MIDRAAIDDGCAEVRTSLLNLPRELRDLVYLALIAEQHTPSEDPEHTQHRLPNSRTPSTIYFETRNPRPALLQLKLCCQQLHAEVSETLREHAGPRIDQAILDVMVKGSSIWPSWVRLPLTPYMDPTIQVNLRIFESSGWGSEFNTGAYRGLWSLFHTLVFRGPCGRSELKRPLDIGRLTFDIRLCFPTSVDDLFGTYRDVFDRIERLATDNVGLGHVGEIEACMGPDRRLWRLKQLPTGLTFASRV